MVQLSITNLLWISFFRMGDKLRLRYWLCSPCVSRSTLSKHSPCMLM